MKNSSGWFNCFGSRTVKVKPQCVEQARREGKETKQTKAGKASVVQVQSVKDVTNPRGGGALPPLRGENAAIAGKLLLSTSQRQTAPSS
ncbi:hypothetical protein DID78_06575 [Candidatus Marinamargulisbacteria bacterium SCGC AG-343-D04]|nr:hypothetical protein DID78_06575 [Candidatus Marinamargulisbacteria bacterium SCGC AG-343-D04]